MGRLRTAVYFINSEEIYKGTVILCADRRSVNLFPSSSTKQFTGSTSTSPTIKLTKSHTLFVYLYSNSSTCVSSPSSASPSSSSPPWSRQRPARYVVHLAIHSHSAIEVELQQPLTVVTGMLLSLQRRCLVPGLVRDSSQLFLLNGHVKRERADTSNGAVERCGQECVLLAYNVKERFEA